MAMQKILVARPIFTDVIERLEQYFEVDWNNGDALAPDALAARLADKDGALTAGDPIGAAALAAAPRLRVVSNMAVGYNNFDMAAFNAANVLGTNTPDVLNESTADFGWALMMAAARRSPNPSTGCAPGTGANGRTTAFSAATSTGRRSA
jgi:lactate dehydrogenase-like 2-hydroxyacid dehydrogenase